MLTPRPAPSLPPPPLGKERLEQEKLRNRQPKASLLF
jgi:hypothetical protein